MTSQIATHAAPAKLADQSQAFALLRAGFAAAPILFGSTIASR